MTARFEKIAGNLKMGTGRHRNGHHVDQIENFAVILIGDSSGFSGHGNSPFPIDVDHPHKLDPFQGRILLGVKSTEISCSDNSRPQSGHSATLSKPAMVTRATSRILFAETFRIHSPQNLELDADQSYSGFLGYLRKSRLFCVNLSSIAFDTPRPENLNGTQIKSNASHTLIFADYSKSRVWGYLRKSGLFCVNLRSIAFDTPRAENLN
jgi:hypothetical protein